MTQIKELQIELEKLQANVARLYSKRQDAYDTMNNASAASAKAHKDWIAAHEEHRLADGVWYHLTTSTRGKEENPS